MSDMHPYSLSKFFSALLGKDVAFALSGKKEDTRTPRMFGEYRVEPAGGATVVVADLKLLARFAAALLGLPEEAAVERSLLVPMDEPVRDAIHEVMNVSASGVATTNRLVFTKMTRESIYLSEAALETLKAPLHTYAFDVKLAGTDAGRFVVLSL